MLRESNEDVLFPEATGEATIGEIWSASQDVTMTLTESYMQSEARKTAAQFGKKLSPEMANERFPGLNADREITEGEAQYLYDWKKEKQEKQKIIDSASDSFLKGTVLPFVAGAAESLKDPAEVAIGFLTGGIGNGLAKGASIGKKVGIDMVEAAASQSIAEAPIMYETNESFEKYTVEQFAQNALLASVMQVGIVHGGSAAYKGTAKAMSYAGEKTTENLMRLQRNLEANGINSTKIVDNAMNKIKDSFEDVSVIKSRIAEHFPDTDLEGVANFEDAMNIVKKKFDNDEISVDEMDAFAKDAFESGVDPEMMKRSVEDSQYEFPDDFVEETKTLAKDESQQVGYDNKYYKEIEEMEKAPVESIDDDIIKSYQETVQNLPEDMKEMAIDMGDGKSVKLGELDADVKARQSEQVFMKEFAVCLRGQ